MKLAIALFTLMFSLPAMACEGGLLDQDFRRLASEENVNL
jgi:hypothetical protein